MPYEFHHVKQTEHELYCAEEHIGAVRQRAIESGVLEKGSIRFVGRLFISAIGMAFMSDIESQYSTGSQIENNNAGL